MSAINSCCPPCPSPPTQVPGAPGDDGIPGANGVNAFSTIASFQGVGFLVPAVGASATVYLTDTGEWMQLGQPVYVSGGGQYQVTATASTGVNGTSVQLKNLGSAGNAIPGSTISAGNTIAPSGLQGNNAYSTTTATFSWTTFGTSSTITCTGQGNTVAWMEPNQIVFVSGAGYFQVNGSPNVVAGTASLTLLQYAGNTQNGSVAPGAGVSPGGVQGSQPLPTVPAPFYATGLSAAIGTSSSNIDTAIITLPGPGTWLIFARLAFSAGFVSSTAYGNAITVTSVLQSQVGAGPLSPVANSQASVGTFSGAAASSIGVGGSIDLPPSIYSTANSTDKIYLYASYAVGNASSVDHVNATEVYLYAICINATT